METLKVANCLSREANGDYVTDDRSFIASKLFSFDDAGNRIERGWSILKKDTSTGKYHMYSRADDLSEAGDIIFGRKPIK